MKRIIAAIAAGLVLAAGVAGVSASDNHAGNSLKVAKSLGNSL